MPRLPTRDDLSQAPSARSGRPIATFDTTAVGRGAEAGGRAIQAAAADLANFAKQQEALAEYEAEQQAADFRWNEEVALDDAKRTVQPGQAAHFADTWQQGYAGRADTFIRSLPDAARPQVRAKLKAAERVFFRDAATFGRGEQKRSSLAGLDDYRSRIIARPGNLERASGEYANLVDRNPWLTPVEKEETRRKGLRDIEKAHVEGLIERGEGLDAILRDLEGEPLDTDANPEARARPFRGRVGGAGGEGDAASAAITSRLETGKTNPLEGVGTIARDAGGTRSYGNMGLNSGGSAQAFVREYGEALGLSGEPGTPAFDRSWKQVATNDPEGLHQAEMAWYRDNITSRIGDRLKAAGVDEALAADPRVQAYFSDRAIQQGAGSIDEMSKHRKRIKAAADEAGGDPVAFLKAITEADRGALGSDFPTALRTGVYSQRGHDNRLDGRLRLALGTGGGASLPATDAVQYAGPYKNLTPDQRIDLARSARARLKTSLEAGREGLKRALDDDVESIRRTGRGTEPDVAMAERVLEPNQVGTYRLNRAEALAEYEAMRDLPSLSDSALSQRLADLEPAPGELGFNMRAKIHDKLKKAVDGDEGIRTLRLNDPARAVEAVPEVRAATELLRADPESPEALQTLVRARLDAQAKVGIPEGIRAPIARSEAKVIASPLRGLEGKALTEAIGGWREDLDARYGPYARAVALSAIDQAITRDKELAEIAESQINRLLSGQRPSAALVRRGEFIADVNAATEAIGGDFVGDPRLQYGLRERGGPVGMEPREMPAYGPRQPPQGAIDMLLGNPSMASAFNAKYGNGAAERILMEARQ